MRYQPRIVIPLGLFTIGLGFVLMKFGSSAEHASWLTMLPGSLLAGTGLGLTNTPTTNTATGSVTGNRAGMASGIDMSARLITLAINIALMGFILVEGILSYLKGALPVSVNSSQLHSLAEKIASGNFATLREILPELSSLDPSEAVVHSALTYGFGLVLLYGGIGVWILAMLSFLIFGSGQSRNN